MDSTSTKNTAAARQRVHDHLRGHLDALADAAAPGLNSLEALRRVEAERVRVTADLDVQVHAAGEQLQDAFDALRDLRQSTADIAALLDLPARQVRPRRPAAPGETAKVDPPTPLRPTPAPVAAPSEGRAS